MLEIDIEKRIVNGVWEGYIGRVNRQSIRVFTGKRMSGVELNNFFASGSLDNTKLKVYGPDGPIYLTYESIDISSPGSVAAYSPRVFVEERTLERFIDNFDQYVEGSSGVAKAAAQEALDAKDQLTTDVSQALSTLNEDKQTAINELNQVKESNRKRYLDPVATVAERDSAYPTPENGDSVWVSGEGKMYRYNGTEWKVTNENDPSAIDMVNQQLADKTQDFLSLSKTMEGGTSAKDNHSLLTGLVERAKAEGKGVYIPNGRYFLSENFTISGVKNVQIDGEIVMAEGKYLELHYSSARTDSCVWSINSVSGKLRLSGMKNSSVNVVRATTLELYANGDDSVRSSIAYSRFYLGFVNSLRIFSEGLGWINENSFFGGRMKDIYITGNYHHNNNAFYKPMLEGCTINIEKGHSNRFYGVRFEGVNSVTFGAGTYNNIIYRTWFGAESTSFVANKGDASDITLLDNGSNSVEFETGTESETLLNINRYNPGNLTVNGELVRAGTWAVILKTGMVELPAKGKFAISVVSDVPGIRTVYTFFDADGVQISGDTDPVILDSSQAKWNGADGTYRYSSNAVKNTTSVIDSSKAKYVRLDVTVGGVTMDFRSLRVIMTKYKNLEIPWMKDAIQHYYKAPAS